MTVSEFYLAVINELEWYPQAKLHHTLLVMEMICPGFSFDETLEVFTDESEIGIAVKSFYSNK